LKGLLREPLLHFFVLGALLFAAYGVIAGGGESPGEIVVTRAQIENLAAVFGRTWQRAPNEQELGALIEGWVREEVLYREGLALGLDRDDPVIRNRVRLKLEFIGEEAEAAEPDDAQLQAWLDARAAEYAREPGFTFAQVFFDPARRAGSLEADLAQALAALRSDDAAAEGLGDATLLPPEQSDTTPAEIASVFGADFAAALAELAPGNWQGPLRSPFGVHLVRVSQRREGGAPALPEVREQVARDWSAARAREAKGRFYQGLRARYQVKIEAPPLAPLADAR
jgi:hypothetical protein